MIKLKQKVGDDVKQYEKLVELGCFSLKDVMNELDISQTCATYAIQKYLSLGYIERIRRDLYVAISIETKQPVLSRYQIGSRLFSDSYISHHSAFEVFGYANQVFYEVYVATDTRFRDFVYNGVLYHRTDNKYKTETQTIDGVNVSTIEQTVIESICDMEKIGGLEEILRCILLIPSLNYKKLLSVLEKYDNGYLYQKCGYIFEGLNYSLHLPNSFFDECKKHIPNAKRYLTKDHAGYVWHEKWKLYAPENIDSIINKGVNDYDEI